MKYLLFGFISLFFAGVHSSLAQNGMHLEYKTTLSASQKSSAMHVYILPAVGARSEMEMAFPHLPKPIKMVSVYLVQKPNTSIQIDDEQKTYTEYSQPKPPAPTTEKPTVQVIGNEKINGYSCVHSKVTTGKLAYDIWTTKEITGYDELAHQIYGQQSGNFQGIWTQLKAKNADGLMVKMTSASRSMMTMELVKAEKKGLTTGMFSPPSDYKKVDKNAFIQQRMQATMKDGQ